MRIVFLFFRLVLLLLRLLTGVYLAATAGLTLGVLVTRSSSYAAALGALVASAVVGPALGLVPTGFLGNVSRRFAVLIRFSAAGAALVTALAVTYFYLVGHGQEWWPQDPTWVTLVEYLPGLATFSLATGTAGGLGGLALGALVLRFWKRSRAAKTSEAEPGPGIWPPPPKR